MAPRAPWPLPAAAALALALAAACGPGLSGSDAPDGPADLPPADAPDAPSPGDPGADPSDAPDAGGPAWPAGVSPLAPEAAPVMAGGLPAESAPDLLDRPLSETFFEAANRALSRDWRFRFDGADAGLEARWFAPAHGRADWRPVPVPAAWDLAFPELFDTQGPGWYAVEFPLALPLPVPAVVLRFDGAFREVRAWLNGDEVGGDDLPYLPFAFDVTPLLSPTGRNLLVVRVDNRLSPSTLPCTVSFQQGLHGWMPYGGLTRPVHLAGSLPTAVTRVAVLRADPATGEFAADVRLRREPSPRAAVRVQARLLRGEDVAHAWDPFDLPPGHDGGFSLAATVPAPNDGAASPPGHVPYRLEVALSSPEGLRDRTGYDVAFRTFQARDGRFRADGKDVFLHGMNRHEDHPRSGPAYDPNVGAWDVGALREMHVDFVRPGHYPNDVRMLRDYEAAGIRVAEEVPVYQWEEPHFADPVLVDRALRAARRMVVRDQHRPGVAMWSVANEIWTFVPAAEPFVAAMVDAVKALDPTRPVMLASLSELLLSYTPFDTGAAPVDVVGINEYAGWYEGTAADLPALLDRARERWPDKVLFVSEYGADALAGRTLRAPPGDEPPDGHSLSEEWQAWFHRQHLRAFAERPWIRGVMPWVFADFRMQWRPSTARPFPADRTNLKGVVDAWRHRKAAFRVLAEAFADPGGLSVPPEPRCGDGRTDPGEACDGDRRACESLGAFQGGGAEAPCRDDCRGHDVSPCPWPARDPREYEVVKPAERFADRFPLARCNDGSPFAFRVRPSPSRSRDWVVSLRGGGFCEDRAVPCIRSEDLYRTTPLPDGAAQVPDDDAGGVLDPDAADNPDFAGANLVFAWYCTSDFWAGTRTGPVPTMMAPEEGWRFPGRVNVAALLDTLAAAYGLEDHPETRVLFHGTSSGAFGAAATADLLADRLPGAAAGGRVKVLLDAGWLVHDWDEPDARVVLSEEGDAAVIRHAHGFFQAALNPGCEAARARARLHPGDCLFGRWSLPFLADAPPAGLGLPVLVVQSLMDTTFAEYHNHRDDDRAFLERYGARQWADVLLADPGPDADPPRPLKAWWFLAWEPFHDETRETGSWGRGAPGDRIPDVIGRFWQGAPPERVVFDPRPRASGAPRAAVRR